MLRHSLFIAASCAAWSAPALPPAHACSFAPHTEHVIDPEEETADTTPPGVPVLPEPQFSRRPSGPACDDSNSCTGSGSIGVIIDAPADDRTPGAEMGYVLTLATGTLPTNMTLPETPVRAEADGTIWFYFSDQDQSIDFTLSVRAMDLGGNLGTPALVRVTHAGDVGCVDDGPGGGPGEVGGCSAGARAGLGTAAMVLLVMALVLPRRRASRA
jgi:hypothetical protein